MYATNNLVIGPKERERERERELRCGGKGAVTEELREN